MPSEIINVGKIMRQEAYLKNSKRGKTYPFKISSKAIQEEISFLVAKIESDVCAVCNMHFQDAKRKNNIASMKKTVMEEDIIMVNAFKGMSKRQEVDIVEEVD